MLRVETVQQVEYKVYEVYTFKARCSSGNKHQAVRTVYIIHNLNTLIVLKFAVI